MQEWFERMNREFADATRQWEGTEGLPMGRSSPDADLVEHDEEFVVTIDLPGFSPEDVTARVTDQTLFVDAEWSTEETDEEGEFVRRERQHRSQSRRIQLPQAVDTADVDATMKNGVLTLTIPKAIPDSEGQSIDIE
jgi:HSP20 family protein